MKTLLLVILMCVPMIQSYESPTPSNELRQWKVRKADFRTALTYVLNHEGYYAWTANDSGGETYAGITRKYCPQWNGWKHIDAYKRNRGRMYNNLHIDDPVLDHWVLDFYLNLWVTERFYQLNDQVVANYVFDYRINAYTGIQHTQLVLQRLGVNVHDDNIMGQSTADAINLLPRKLLLSNLRRERIGHYRSIVKSRPSQKPFLTHWLYRANNLPS